MNAGYLQTAKKYFYKAKMYYKKTPAPTTNTYWKKYMYIYYCTRKDTLGVGFIGGILGFS